MTISPARRAAFEILRRVEQEDAYASVLLGALDEQLRSDDRALCHELVLGVLRHRLWLDCVLQHFANRPLEDFDLPVKVALRIGLYQLRFLTRIPPSAAVNESVKLVRAARLKSAAALVNAILRRATREPHYDPTTGVADPVEKLAIETSHPQWLIETWANNFGFEETMGLARADNNAAPIAFRLTAKALESEESSTRIMEEFETSGAQVTASSVAPDAWRVSGAGIDRRSERSNTLGLVLRLSREGLI
jgi:16S rRNA (cytosine967-C5)-methyltransferase